MEAAPAEQVSVVCFWTGPSTRRTSLGQWQYSVEVVDLLFRNALAEVSVHIPEDFPPTETRQLSFVCRRHRGGRPVETRPEILNLSVEQIRDLTLRAGYFQKSSCREALIMESSGRVTSPPRVQRRDKVVSLALPETVEPGKAYRLSFLSKDIHTIEAQLVPEEGIANGEELIQRAQDRAELLQKLTGVLVSSIGAQMIQFIMRLVQLSIDPHFFGTAIGLSEIQSELNKIQETDLKELVSFYQRVKASWNPGHVVSESNRRLEKELFGKCFQVLGDEGLKNIMSSFLRNHLPAQISPELDALIASTSVSYKDALKGATALP